MDFEVDRPPPTHSPPRDFLMTMVKETVIIQAKSFEKLKKVKLVGIFHLSESDENATDCEIACDCVKHANVVVGLRKEIFARTHLPASRHLLSAL